MLYKYLDLLHRATDSLTSLGSSNATWTDCFKTIGYEFLVLGIGILYVAAIAAIILIPTIGTVKILKKIKSHELQKHTILTNFGYKQCYDLFLSVLKNLQDANCKEYLLTLVDNLSNAYIMAEVTKRYMRKLQELKSEIEDGTVNCNNAYQSAFQECMFAGPSANGAELGRVIDWAELRHRVVKNIKMWAAGITCVGLYAMIVVPMLMMLF